MKQYKPYVIRTPAFDPTSGGIRVMWGLYGWLLAKGQLAYVNTLMDTPTIGIYPEIYRDNDLQAEKVIRYILQTPGVMGTSDQGGTFKTSPTTEEYKTNPLYENDEFYVFSKIYDTFGVDENHLMFLPILNLGLFKDLGKKRTKTCYLVGKGDNTHKHPEDSIELTREFSLDQKALADLLNECQYMYCYEPTSAMMEIARLCGCKIKYFGGKSKMELELYEPGIDGIDFGKGCEFKSERFRYNYGQLVKTFSNKLDRFIEDTQQ